MNTAPTRTKFVERFIDAGGARVRFREAGSGDPLLVLAGENEAEPGFAEAILAESRRVLIVTRPAGTPRHAAATVTQAIAALGLEQAALLASSLEAPVALWLAIDVPASIRTIVLESPLAFSSHLPPLAGRSDAEFRGYLNAHPERKAAIAAPDAATFATRARQSLGPSQDQDFMQRLPAFDPPVLTLLGTRDALAPVELGRFYKTLMPNSWFLIVYDAAHDISGDRPEAFADVVGDFLRRGAQFAVGERSSRLHR